MVAGRASICHGALAVKTQAGMGMSRSLDDPCGCGELGDEIMIITRGSREPVCEGHIRGIRHDLDGLVYLVEWSDTGSVDFWPHGPDVVIKRMSTCARGHTSLV